MPIVIIFVFFYRFISMYNSFPSSLFELGFELPFINIYEIAISFRDRLKEVVKGTMELR